jgi:hypothetical protein
LILEYKWLNINTIGKRTTFCIMEKQSKKPSAAGKRTKFPAR